VPGKGELDLRRMEKNPLVPLDDRAAPSDAGRPLTAPGERQDGCRVGGAPHVGLPAGTRVIVNGAAGHYVGLKLPAFGRLEHEVHFDERGRKTLRGDRCHFFGVVWAHLSFALASCSQRGRGWSIDDNEDGAGAVTVGTITTPDGTDVQITAQTTLAELKHGISEELGIPAAEQRLQLVEYEGESDGTVEGADSQFLWEAGVRQGMRVLVVAVPVASLDADGVATAADVCCCCCVEWGWQLGMAGMSVALWGTAAFVPRYHIWPCGAVVWISVGFYQLLLCLGCYMHRMTYSTHEMRAWAVGGGRNDPRHCARMVAFSLAAWVPLLYLLYLAILSQSVVGPVPMTSESLRVAVEACAAESATFDCPAAERCNAAGYPIGEWNTSSVTDMGHLFKWAARFDQPIGEWDTSSVTNMDYLFYQAARFDQPIGAWDTSSVTTMGGLFEGAARFDQPIGEWDTSSVTTMAFLFDGAASFRHNVSSWNVSAVTDMGNMFGGACTLSCPTRWCQPDFNGLIQNQCTPC
jgi:surface protein